MNTIIRTPQETAFVNSALSKILGFDFSPSRLIAEFNSGGIPVLIYHDNKSNRFLINYHDRYDIPDPDDMGERFIHCRNFSEALEALNNMIVEIDGIRISHYSGKWWSFLPEWMVLHPVKVDFRFRKKLMSAIQNLITGLNFPGDLTPGELKLVQTWFDYLKDENKNYMS
jgi:hypothetical protein